MKLPTVHLTDHKEPLAALKRTVDALWTHLAPDGKPESLRRILFTAPGRRQGTTTVTLCAALGLARHLQATVTLIEAGAPSATLAVMLGAEPQPGLSEVLAHEAERSTATRQGVDPGLLVMPAGSRPYQPGDLSGERVRDVLAWLAKGRDFLLIDAPPILLHPEAHPLLWEVDQVVVVLDAGRSKKDEARALVKALNEAGVEVLGCILNRYQPDLPGWIGGSRLP
jgi:Mrp family chromosome partitioning ATPase